MTLSTAVLQHRLSTALRKDHAQYAIKAIEELVEKRKTPSLQRIDDRLGIRTVAKAAGVSVATVSRAINRIPTVDPKLKKKVWETIHKLSYVPNTQARALVSGRSKLLGVIISDMTNPFFPELVQGFEDSAIEAGYETLVDSTNYDLHRMQVCVRRMLERKVDGIAVMTFGIEEPLFDRLASQGIPMVFVNRAPRKTNFSTIQVDYEKGIYEAVQHLAVLGHQRIAFITGPKKLHSVSARLRAFYFATEGIGLRIPAEYVIDGNHTAEGGKCGTEQLLTLSDRPTAIMCSNDLSAIGAMHAISDAGLSIPQDISLIRFDDIRIAELMLPPPTAIRMSGRDIAASAVASLLAPSAQPKKVETRLVVRRTTAVLRSHFQTFENKKASSEHRATAM